MKILLIHQYFLRHKGSGGSRFNEMAKIWTSQGHEVTVIAGMIFHNSGKKYKDFEGKIFCNESFDGIKIIRCHDSNGSQKSFFRRLIAYSMFTVTSIIAGIFYAKEKYDCIIVSSPPLFVGFSGVIISFIKRIPLVFEVRDLWPESAIDTGVLKNKLLIKFSYLIEKYIYNCSTLINVLTPAFYDVMIKEKKISKSKLSYIPNGSDFNLSKVSLQKFNRTEFRKKNNFNDYFVIVYVGAHGIANNLIQLISAAERLKKSKVIFLLIGNGMEKKSLIQEANKLQLKNVIFMDSISKENVFKYLSASDAGISVLKKTDTFKTIYSNKTFDYMTCKLPVLMAIDGISKKLVNDAKCGYYIEPENLDHYEKVILRLINTSREDLKIMGNNGYNHAKKHFDREVLAKKFISNIKKIL